MLLGEHDALAGALTFTTTVELAGPLDTLYVTVRGALGEQNVVVSVRGSMLTTGWVMAVTLVVAESDASQPAKVRALAARVTVKLVVTLMHVTVTSWLTPPVATEVQQQQQQQQQQQCLRQHSRHAASANAAQGLHLFYVECPDIASFQGLPCHMTIGKLH
jgi:hypothetical protein